MGGGEEGEKEKGSERAEEKMKEKTTDIRMAVI